MSLGPWKKGKKPKVLKLARWKYLRTDGQPGGEWKSDGVVDIEEARSRIAASLGIDPDVLRLTRGTGHGPHQSTRAIRGLPR